MLNLVKNKFVLLHVDHYIFFQFKYSKCKVIFIKVHVYIQQPILHLTQDSELHLKCFAYYLSYYESGS